MKRVLVFIVLCVVALAFFVAPPSRAEIWSEVTGNAAEHITYICAPCCKITNYHPTRRVRARLFTLLYPREVILAPHETETFNAPRECMKAGFGLEAVFID